MSKCLVKKCKKPAIWEPILCLYPPKMFGLKKPIRMILGLRICDYDKRRARLKHFLTDGTWDNIVVLFKKLNKVRPDRDRIVLDFDRVA